MDCGHRAAMEPEFERKVAESGLHRYRPGIGVGYRSLGARRRVLDRDIVGDHLRRAFRPGQLNRYRWITRHALRP